MKTLLILASLLSFSFSSFAETLNCGYEGTWETAIGLKNTVLTYCNDYEYKLSVSGVGVNLEAIAGEGSPNGFVIYCPVQDEVKGNYYGGEVSAGFLFGASVGVMMQKGKPCFLLGAGLNHFGLAINGMRFNFQKASY